MSNLPSGTRPASKRPFRMIAGVSQLSDLKDGGAGYPGDYPGRVYYVNNITGSSSYDGLSWETPFDEVSTAITASEAFRVLPSGTTNDYVRNVIYVQGTGTAYTALSALPLYCDIIGIGANVRGTNQGVPRIGSDTVAESGCITTVTVRGLGVYNIQFQAGIDKHCLDIASMYRSEFVNCSFMTNGAATGNPDAGVRVSAGMGSVIFRDCFFGSSCSVDTEPDIGFSLEGTSFHNCLIEDCFITGLTAGIYVASTCVTNWGSWVRNNFIGDGSQTMAIAVDDNSAGHAHITYTGNYVRASGVAFDLEVDGGARCIGNYEINGFVAANA